jgi:hypothetical protein
MSQQIANNIFWNFITFLMTQNLFFHTTVCNRNDCMHVTVEVCSLPVLNSFEPAIEQLSKKI